MITTVNLEKKLIKQNKKLLNKNEQMLVNEYKKHNQFVDDEILENIGLDNNIKKGRQIKFYSEQKFFETKNFNSQKVFHISQIQSTCEKYYLRFLPANHYSGTIDSELTTKISNFQIAHNRVCNVNNSFIMAPKKSFKLEEKPKDPLFFYRINDEYYYLIHKWGNDLSIFRRLLSFLSKKIVAWIIICFIPLTFFWIQFHDFVNNVTPLTIFYAIISITVCGILTHHDGGDRSILKKNEWDSHYL